VALGEETLALMRGTMPAHDPEVVTLSMNLSNIYRHLGRTGEAIALGRPAVEEAARVFGPDHPSVITAKVTLALAYSAIGKYDEAAALDRDVEDSSRRAGGVDDPRRGAAHYNLACLAGQRGDREEALRLLSETLERKFPIAIAKMVADDPDLKPLHGDPRFEAIVARFQKRAR
jgi:tetratricopeptide (TPR) repeat protein